MEKLKTIQVKTVREDEDNLVQGGVNFYWVPGARIVLCHEWEYKGSGPVWKDINPDPMSGDNFLDYLLGCWSEYRVVDVVGDFC